MTLSLHQEANNTISEIKPFQDNREAFFKNAPRVLSKLLATHEIEMLIDDDKVTELLNHTGIIGGPRGYFKLKVNDVFIDLKMSELITLCSDASALKKFIKTFPSLSKWVDQFKDRYHSPFKKGNMQYNGDIFYSDISLNIDDEFGKSSIRTLIFSLTCEYLRESNYFISS